MSLLTGHLAFQAAVLLSLVTLGIAQTSPLWTTDPFNPPALPLAVRSPYLNAWLFQGNNPGMSSNTWPTLWTPVTPTILGWSAAVQVDGHSFSVLGSTAQLTPNVSTQTAVEFTPTRTSFILKAGPVNVNASFLSPIEPTDLVRQSLPFAYLSIDISSNDGQAHDVKVYSDISAEWISGDNGLIANWTANASGDVIILQTQLEAPGMLAEINDHAQDATAFYSAAKQPGVTYQIGQDSVVRGFFATNGTLRNTVDPAFRAVSNDFAVFAISADLGSITNTSAPVVWGLGLLRDPAVRYTGSSGRPELRSAYFWSQYPTAEAAIEFAVNDFARASSTAAALDAQIAQDAARYGPAYTGLLSLALRQALGTAEITLARSADGSWNTSDVKAFVKDIGGGGSVSDVGVLYATFPAYLYLNPQLCGFLLAPLLEFQESTLYTNVYAAQNLGTNYPNATGNADPHNLGIEESANMLIMSLAHAQASGDGSLLGKHYNLLNQWAQYLVNNSLTPGNQITADSLTAANQTNLAIKGIIGIGAMARISAAAGRTADSAMYMNVSATYVQMWQQLAMSSDGGHLLADYGAQSSSGLIYNLFADKLLQLNLVPDSVYQTQTAFYANAAVQNQNKFGLPIDTSTQSKTRVDWMMLTASSINDAPTRDLLISQVHGYASASLNNTPLSVIYDASTGIILGDNANPAQGAMFSLLALNQTIQNVSMPSSGGVVKSASHSNAGAIAGGVVGGLVALGALGLLVFCLRRRQGKRARRHVSLEPDPAYLVANKLEVAGLPHGTTFEHFTLPMPVPLETSTLRSPTSPEAYPQHPYSYSPIEHPQPDEDAVPRERGVSMSTVGPSASQVGGSSTVSSAATRSTGARSTVTRSAGVRSTSTATTTQQVLVVKQEMVNEELRSEVDNLRREMERIREERTMIPEEAPPSYFPHLERDQ